MAKKNQNILRYVLENQSRRGICYACPDGKLISWLRVIFLVFTIYTAGINIIYIIGCSLKISVIAKNPSLLSAAQENSIALIKNYMITVGLFTVLLVLCYILLSHKNLLTALSALIINTVSCTMLFVTFYKELSDSLEKLGMYSSFIWRHGIPLILLFIIGPWAAALTVRFRLKENRAYNKMVNSLYERYSTGFDSLSSKQWQEFLDAYEPDRPEKLKRSRRTRARKENRPAEK